MTFRLARMSGAIMVLTVFMLALFVALAAGAVLRWRILFVPAAFLALIYLWVWLRFRPLRFVVHPHEIEVIWPLKRRRIPRSQLRDVRRIDAADLRSLLGWFARIGVGGLWGAFGWLWTQKRGIVQTYISRTSDFVWLERGPTQRPWLITPERPDEFVAALRS
jgi:hypothetical protein